MKKVCKECGEKKDISEFQKQPYEPKTKRSDGHRHECRKCQNKKSRAAYLKRTTPEDRAVYQREYHKTYRK